MPASYKTISKTYGLLDAVFFRKNSPRIILMDKIPNKAGKLLEIAVGTAENSMLLAKNKPQLHITGIDISDEMLNLARQSINQNDITNIKLIKMDGSQMTFDNKTFDFIVISLLFHEIPEKLTNKILAQCLNILKDDGKIFILEWERPKKLIQKIVFSVIDLLEMIANGDEYKRFMKKAFDLYFLKNGFKLKNTDYGNYTKVMELAPLTKIG